MSLIDVIVGTLLALDLLACGVVWILDITMG